MKYGRHANEIDLRGARDGSRPAGAHDHLAETRRERGAEALLAPPPDRSEPSPSDGELEGELEDCLDGGADVRDDAEHTPHTPLMGPHAQRLLVLGVAVMIVLVVLGRGPLVDVLTPLRDKWLLTTSDAPAKQSLSSAANGSHSSVPATSPRSVATTTPSQVSVAATTIPASVASVVSTAPVTPATTAGATVAAEAPTAVAPTTVAPKAEVTHLQIVPAVRDVIVVVNGNRYTSDPDGTIALAPADRHGDAEVFGLGASPPLEHMDFIGWGDGDTHVVRPLDSLTGPLAQIAFSLSYRVQTAAGTIPPGQATVVFDTTIGRQVLTIGQPEWLVASRAVASPAGLVTEPVVYTALSFTRGPTTTPIAATNFTPSPEAVWVVVP
ncbi:MAG: hypothetical protein JWM12_2362 [Ilumatobacteraceae bacterium]|nr:hypothetical protein [Ilumatobacteraceae bacterium]